MCNLVLIGLGPKRGEYRTLLSAHRIFAGVYPIV